jgi:hypothetical protein
LGVGGGGGGLCGRMHEEGMKKDGGFEVWMLVICNFWFVYVFISICDVILCFG